jgi:ATP-dependent RNA helicase DDX1
MSQEKLMHFPTWVDLKGEDAVPETVHHVVAMVDPQKDRSWQNLHKHIMTDGVHAQDDVRPGNNSPETLSEAVKMLKGEYCVRAIDQHKMDRAIIFCRTKVDCDNLEKYFKQIDKNKYSCVCLHGDRKPHERKGNLEAFKKASVKFLICTDVAARGLDITGLPFSKFMQCAVLSFVTAVNMTLSIGYLVNCSDQCDSAGRKIELRAQDRQSGEGGADGPGHKSSELGSGEGKKTVVVGQRFGTMSQVWYHGEWCKSRGRNCWNTNLVEQKGCCIWYNEPQVCSPAVV